MKIRVETTLNPETARLLKAYALSRYNGNRGLAIEESVEQLIKRERKAGKLK